MCIRDRAESLPDHLDTEVVTERVARVTDLVEQLTAQRAEERIGSEVTVLIEAFDDDEGMPVGRAEFQGPEVDGVTSLPGADVRVGDIVPAIITTSRWSKTRTCRRLPRSGRCSGCRWPSTTWPSPIPVGRHG